MSADNYDPYDFANRRHIGPSAKEIAEMLAVVGASDLHAMIDATVPQSIRQAERIDFGKSLSERRALDRLSAESIQRTNSLCDEFNPVDTLPASIYAKIRI